MHAFLSSELGGGGGGVLKTRYVAAQSSVSEHHFGGIPETIKPVLNKRSGGFKN